MPAFSGRRGDGGEVEVKEETLVTSIKSILPSWLFPCPQLMLIHHNIKPCNNNERLNTPNQNWGFESRSRFIQLLLIIFFLLFSP
jgi:hypothetical protein